MLPKAGLQVRPVEEYKEKDAPFAYYYPPSATGDRDGIYYANGYDLPSRKYTKLASTTYHEAAPGHHFQIALEMENPDLITFRRLGARMVGGAYVEGWGLYSERLADEMGLYRSEAERFGMLDAQAWRAARLVVDTGMHALRWERQRSIDFLRNDAGLSETDAVIETDRYICWPGQALTYMLGQRQIQACAARSRPVMDRASTCASSTTRCSGTGRCHWRRSPASCRPGSPRRPEAPNDLATTRGPDLAAQRCTPIPLRHGTTSCVARAAAVCAPVGGAAPWQTPPDRPSSPISPGGGPPCALPRPSLELSPSDLSCSARSPPCSSARSRRAPPMAASRPARRRC